MAEALIYLSWLQFVTNHVVNDKQHVFINVDETSVSAVKATGKGMVATGKIKQESRWRQPRDPVDRTDVKTTSMGAACDAPELQPLLPQVVLPRYTKAAVPPQHVLDAYAVSDSPLEYWHKSSGWVGSRIMTAWITRVRTIVTSFNPAAWIVLIIDCSNAHLNVKTIRHMRRLGVLVVFLPAKLTWLLQVLDAYAFGELKGRMRVAQTAVRVGTATGSMDAGSWVDVTAAAIRHVLVDRDWSDAFTKLGTGSSDQLRDQLQEYVLPADVIPRLPSLEQFAALVNRPAHTDVTRRVYNMIMGQHLAVRRLTGACLPPRGARVDLPDVAAAQKRQRSDDVAGLSWDNAITEHLTRRPRVSGLPAHGRSAALNVILDIAAPDDTS